MSLDPVFTSEESFRSAFSEGLGSMLDSSELGAFILVLANASFDKDISSQLQKRLARQFTEWSDLFDSNPDALSDFAPDDVAVFRQLQSLGFETIGLTEYRLSEMWQLLFNPIRSFRPARNASQKFDSISLPFDSSAFHFNKSFLQKEIFWQGNLFGQDVRLLYNKFPFANLHGLFVINPLQNKPQLLDKTAHELVWQLLHTAGPSCPMGIGYNSIGAYASVNHQHLQSFVSRKKYPIELGCWEHNGGTLQYPLDCKKFIQVDDAWHHIEALHNVNVPYNLLYREGEMYCVSRAFQGGYEHSNWTSGFAWSEVSGAMTVSSQKAFRKLQAVDIEKELQKLRRI